MLCSAFMPNSWRNGADDGLPHPVVKLIQFHAKVIPEEPIIHWQDRIKS